MSYERFNFYIYVILNELNKIKISGKNDPTLKQIDPVPRSAQPNRKKTDSDPEDY